MLQRWFDLQGGAAFARATVAKTRRAVLRRFAICAAAVTVFLAASLLPAHAAPVSVRDPLTYNTLTFQFNLNDNVDLLRSEIAARTGYSVDRLRLIYAGREMVDGWRSVNDYALYPNRAITILLVLRPATVGTGGGGPILVPVDDPILVYELGDVATISGAQSVAGVNDATLGRVFAFAGGSGDGVTTSTKGGFAGAGGARRFWLSQNIVSLSGFQDGTAKGIVAGADWMRHPDLLFGAYVLASSFSFGTAGDTTFGVGLYGGLRLGPNWTLAAQAGHSRITYDAAGRRTSGARDMAAVALSGGFGTRDLRIDASFQFSGFVEDVSGFVGGGFVIPADRLRQREAKANLTIQAQRGLWSGPLVPYGRFWLAQSATRSEFSGEVKRDDLSGAAFGLSGPVGQGSLSVQFALSDTPHGLRAARFSLGYGIGF